VYFAVIEMHRLVQKPLWLALLSAVWLAACGCAARTGPAAYRLLAQDDQRILVPPGVKDAHVTQRTFDFHTSADARDCGGGEGGLKLQQRRRDRLRLTVDRDALEQQPAGWLTQWTTALEDRGCLAPGDGFPLATRIAQALPWKLNTEQRLLNPDARSSGYTDLRPGYRLRVVSPVFRDDAPPGASALQQESKVGASAGGLTITANASPDLIGYETAWYAVEPRASGGRARIVPQFAEFHSEGEVTREKAPRRNPLAFDPAMAYFRLLFMSRRTESSDHDIVVVAASTQPKLDEKTRALEAGTETCVAVASAASPDVTRAARSTARVPPAPAPTVVASQSACSIAPRQVAIVAFLQITVQGKEVLAQPGETLDSALREGGADHPEEILSTLVVRKPYDGRLTPVEFSRATPDILELPLAGGEEIHW
jgi:hypothetical protein